jgi:hypothetical protein
MVSVYRTTNKPELSSKWENLHIKLQVNLLFVRKSSKKFYAAKPFLFKKENNTSPHKNIKITSDGLFLCSASSVFHSGVCKDSVSMKCDRVLLHHWILTLPRK